MNPYANFLQVSLILVRVYVQFNVHGHVDVDVEAYVYYTGTTPLCISHWYKTPIPFFVSPMCAETLICTETPTHLPTTTHFRSATLVSVFVLKEGELEGFTKVNEVARCLTKIT